MIEEIDRRVSEICESFQNATRINVTPQARTLIAEVISAIFEDPHPAWRISETERRDAVTRYLHTLPEYLSDIAREEGRYERITVFGVLHWLVGNFSLICTITKLPT
jgi:hypothetical protein